MHHDDRDNQSIQHTFSRSIIDEPNKTFTDRIVESFAGHSGSDTDRFAESFAGPSASGSSFTEKTGEENSTDHPRQLKFLIWMNFRLHIMTSRRKLAVYLISILIFRIVLTIA